MEPTLWCFFARNATGDRLPIAVDAAEWQAGRFSLAQAAEGLSEALGQKLLAERAPGREDREFRVGPPPNLIHFVDESAPQPGGGGGPAECEDNERATSGGRLLAPAEPAKNWVRL